jgi:hypothetical protein
MGDFQNSYSLANKFKSHLWYQIGLNFTDMQMTKETSNWIAGGITGLTTTPGNGENQQDIKPKYLRYKFFGNSMNNGKFFESIYDRWNVDAVELVNNIWEQINSNSCYVITCNDGSVIIRKIKQVNLKDSHILCTAVNPNREEYPDLNINLEDVIQICKVCAVDPDGEYDDN